MNYKIIIADDHKMFLDGLQSTLLRESDYSIVFAANDGLEAKNYLDTNTKEKIDLAILDINMPGMDGVQLNNYIKKQYPAIKTLIVSMLTDTSKIIELTDDGVNGYVPKNAQKEELLKAIASILKGNNYFSESIKTAYNQAIGISEKEAPVSLTKREKQILQLIAQEYTTQEIAEKLFLSKHTIEGYHTSLITKLQVKNVAELAKHAIKLNLME